MVPLLAIASLFAMVGEVRGHTSGEVEETCPLDGKTFKAEMDMSGTQFGSQLDLKPVGPTGAPWRLAVCPRDGFVLYKDKFSKDEVADFKAFVETPEFKKWAAEETSYFVAARLREHRKEPPLDVAHTLLKATWQVDQEPARYAKYASDALDHFRAYLATAKPTGEKWQNAVLIAVELERRLGRFEEAKARLAPLKGHAEMKGVLELVVKQESALVEAKDTTPHKVGDASVRPGGGDKAEGAAKADKPH